MIEQLTRIILKILPDDTLCLLHEECFDEMRRRKFIIYEDELNQSEQN
ncbi:MAG: hypothetical protein RMY28_036145 [Nostoc sp. ChiSLP01]|nr:hypothetical protein [Nostoc sp. CmiSLP01]